MTICEKGIRQNENFNLRNGLCWINLDTKMAERRIKVSYTEIEVKKSGKKFPDESLNNINDNHDRNLKFSCLKDRGKSRSLVLPVHSYIAGSLVSKITHIIR